jgi:hypothetical protein
MKNLVLLMIVALMFVSIGIVGQVDTSSVVLPGTEEIPAKVKMFQFLKEINPLNIVLLAISIFAGGLWAMGRNKMKQVGELFLKAYEYTDDKHLSAEERRDLIQRFMCIIGKSQVVSNKVADINKKAKYNNVKK